MVAIAWGKRTGWQRVSDPILSSRVLLYISCCKNGVYWRKHTLRLHRTASTAAQSAQMWFGGKSVPPTPRSPSPDSLVFHFPPVDPVTICLLAVSPWWGEVMVTDPLFLLHMSPQQLPRRFFFSYHSVLNQNSLLNCPLSSQISRADRAPVSRDIHALDSL